MKSHVILSAALLLLTAAAAATAAQPVAKKPTTTVKKAAVPVRRGTPAARKPVAATKPASRNPVTASTKSATTSTAANKGLTWYQPEQGFALAKQQNKPIMVDFYTDWCGWCKVLDEKTFKDPEVMKLLDKFIVVKANAEDKADGTAMAAALRVNGFPTTWFFSPAGDPIGFVTGFAPPADFKPVISKVLDTQTIATSPRVQDLTPERKPPAKPAAPIGTDVTGTPTTPDLPAQ